MKYAYFPGCVAKGACKELDKSTRLVMQQLGIGLTELDAASCCGAGVLNEINMELNHLLNIRTFAQAEKLNLNIMTVCSTCFGSFKETESYVSNNLEKVNKKLSKLKIRYDGKTKVKHLVEIFQEYGLNKLKEQTKTPLTMLKPAVVYGCHLLRPRSIDNSSIENICKALEARPINYEGKNHCCGFPTLTTNRKNSLKLAGRVLLEAKEKKANCIVTACPLCHLNYDSLQPEIEKVIQKRIRLPVLHLSQFIGLSLGFTLTDLGLDKHIVNCEQVYHLTHL